MNLVVSGNQKGDTMSLPRFLAAVAACFLLGASSLAQVIEDRQPGVVELQIESSRITGLASLITGPYGAPIPGIEDRLDPISIFSIHGRLFGITDASSELRRMSTSLCDLGNVHHRYQQIYRGIEVLTGQVIVHQDPQGRFLAVNGDFYPIRSQVPTQPDFSLEDAIFLAAGEMKIENPQTLEEKLVIVDPRWYGDPSDGQVHLAWHMVIGSERVLPQHVLIDAIDGELVDSWPAVHSAINRQVYDGSGGGLPGVLARNEGGAVTGDSNVDAIYDFIGDFYQLLNAGLNRDSLDGAGNALVATANWNDGICPNAIWNGSGTAFCNGLGTDDIVGHEFGHGLTDYTADLIYQNQSGQLNESFSDVFGELIDLWNGNASEAGTPGGAPWPPSPTGGGTDTPNSGRTGCGDASVRWLMGEDSSLGAIRDMWSPQCMGDPPSALDPIYESTSCDPGFDGGGVHFGSGVPNHAFAMVTDGKSFNGQTVTGIGAIKSAAVWFRTLTVYLTPGSDFNQAYTLFNQAASDLVGTTPNDPRTGGPSVSAFTSDDALQIQNALIAVEMNAAGICSPPPPPDNDDCVTATVVAAGIIPIDNSGGTNSGVLADDSQCSGSFLGQVAKDIWFSYTPAQDGTVTLSTCNIASWDTDAVVYTGSCSSLTQVACNGDATGCSNWTSIIENMAVTGGTNYKIRIGSYGSSGGSGEMDLTFTPGGGSPVEVCNNGVDDDGDGFIDCSDSDCALDPACSTTPPEDCTNGVDDDGDGATDCADPDCVGDPACVATADGDECVDAILATLGSNGVNSVGATDSIDLSDPAQCPSTFLGGFFQDIWYSFTPTTDGLFTVSLCGTVTFDSDVSIYVGTCGALDQIACNGDGAGCPGFSSLLSDVPVTAGVEYKIRVGGWNDGANGTGTMELTLAGGTTENCTNGIDDDLDSLIDCEDPDCSGDPSCIPFPADECATSIIAIIGSNPIDTSGATDSGDLVAPCGGSFIGLMSQDIWYNFQPSSNGNLIISTCGTVGFDSSLIVYQGSCGALVQVACDGDFCGLASEVMLPVNGGEQLMIRLGSAIAGVGGIGSLQIDMVVPQPEDCGNGIDDDLDSLVDCLDPDCAADPVCTCDPISGLTCNQGAGLEVLLGWSNGESYDQIQVVRDGSLLANLPGTATNYLDASTPIGVRTYMVTGYCGGSQATAICDVLVEIPAGYRFVAPQVSGEFDELSGVGAVTAAISIGEETDNPGFPNETQGFSMSLAHDPGVLAAVALQSAPILAVMNGGSGPDFMSEALLPGGFTVGIVYSFPGTDTLAFASDTEVLVVYYDTNAAAIAGSSVAVSSSLQWVSTIGTSTVENIVVVNGAGYLADLIDGTVTLDPVAPGGFNRGDCNVDAGFDIADIIHLLDGLFGGGSFSCASACDYNDDALVNVADPIYGLTSLFSGGTPPAAPHGFCGPDPTADALDCVLYDACN